MVDKLATIETKQGNHVATFLQTPDNSHDYEVVVDNEIDPLTEISTLSARCQKESISDPEEDLAIEEHVQEFLELIDHPKADADLVVNRPK